MQHALEVGDFCKVFNLLLEHNKEVSDISSVVLSNFQSYKNPSLSYFLRVLTLLLRDRQTFKFPKHPIGFDKIFSNTTFFLCEIIDDIFSPKQNQIQLLNLFSIQYANYIRSFFTSSNSRVQLKEPSAYSSKFRQEFLTLTKTLGLIPDASYDDSFSRKILDFIVSFQKTIKAVRDYSECHLSQIHFVNHSMKKMKDSMCGKHYVDFVSKIKNSTSPQNLQELIIEYISNVEVSNEFALAIAAEVYSISSTYDIFQFDLDSFEKMLDDKLQLDTTLRSFISDVTERENYRIGHKNYAFRACEGLFGSLKKIEIRMLSFIKKECDNNKFQTIEDINDQIDKVFSTFFEYHNAISSFNESDLFPNMKQLYYNTQVDQTNDEYVALMKWFNDFSY